MDEDWISITDAAGRLAAMGDIVDRSSLSRYLKQHSEALPLKPHGKANLVEFYALSAHRGENIRLRRPIGPGPGLASPGKRTLDRTRFPGTQLDGASRKASADAQRAQAEAELREMDLALRRKQLTTVFEVDQAGREAVATMHGAFERAVENEAQALALKYGWEERVVRIALKNFSRVGLSVFNRVIVERLEALQRREDRDDEDDGSVAEGPTLDSEFEHAG